MATKLSQESLLSFFHPGKLFSSDREDSSDRDDYMETGLKGEDDLFVIDAVPSRGVTVKFSAQWKLTANLRS